MQAVDPAGLEPVGSTPAPQPETEGGLFEARLAAAFSEQGTGEAAPDPSAPEGTFDASGVAFVPAPDRAEVVAGMPPEAAAADGAHGVAGAGSPDPAPDGTDAIDPGAGAVVDLEQAPAPPAPTDGRGPRVTGGAEEAPRRDGALEGSALVGDHNRPRDGGPTATDPPPANRPPDGDRPAPRADAAGRDRSAEPGDGTSAAVRTVFRDAAATPAVNGEATTEPAGADPRTLLAAEPRHPAHAGAPARDMTPGARTRTPEALVDSPMAVPPAAPSSAPLAQDAFDRETQRGPGDESAARPPAAVPRGPVAQVPMFANGEGIPGTAAAPQGTTAVASYALMAPPDRAENAGRLVQSMRVLVRDGVSEATVRLRPEHLGDVNISLRVDGRSVSAVVRAEAPAVREWLQSQYESLRQGLALQGLSLERLEVEPDGSRPGREDHPDAEDRPRRSRPRPLDADSRFEVLV